MKKHLIILSLLLSTISLTAQETYNIITTKWDSKDCIDCRKLISSRPKEVYIHLDLQDTTIYLYVTNRTWFDTIFEKKYDGIAIDIISKDQYKCSDEPPAESFPKGFLMPPVYLKDMIEKVENNPGSRIYIPVATLPAEFRDKEIELNFHYLKEKKHCHSQKMFNLDYGRWELLDMGLFLDSLIIREKEIQQTDTVKTFKRTRILEFKIPFEKDKSVYKPSDIVAMTDSLELTDYTIKEIHIRAYASVEGTEERNLVLQEERARTIADALQTYQSPEIATYIKSMENWVEFYKDIENSEFSYLSDMPRQQIREKLMKLAMQDSLEIYLKNHRKALIIILLEKKLHYKISTEEALFRDFNRSIKEKRLEEAIDIQDMIFFQVEEENIPPESLDKLEIPKTLEYSLLLSRQIMFKYINKFATLIQTLKELEELHELIPHDDHIYYNLCATKLKALTYRYQVDHESLRKEIENLNRTSIPYNLITRMQVNLEIIMSEIYMANGEYRKKDRSLRFIYSRYKDLDLSDKELVVLAKYFASFSNRTLAIRILAHRAEEIDADEDLIYYYLNLTITEDKYMRDYGYRLVLQNAYNLNPDRYCEMFTSNLWYGITFQLLDNPYLRHFYCENCAEQADLNYNGFEFPVLSAPE